MGGGGKIQFLVGHWLVNDSLSLLYGSFSFLTTPNSSSISVGMR